MNAKTSRDEQLFADALARPKAERALFLARACDGDAALLARIAALLAAHDGPESVMASSPVTRPAPQPDLSAVGSAKAEEKPGDRIGHYKLLQQIGEGGCGVVYMAEQEEPVRRRVALKVIKLGMDTKAVVARFEAERQALALMDHPNIAKVLDAGATATGRLFFVMELVRGVPITKYCDEGQLTPTARLELFIKVCQAIQHAHQKGIIHRDIKPSNILVTVNDGQPTPKVIDFGIAKATQGRLTDATVFTAFEQFIGTPVYMSPEQAEISSVDIDTRSDIYSLGVLLYELLTGRPPFDPKVFAQAGVDQIRQQIREVEPARPSARLGTLDDDERTTIARLRGTPAANLSLILRGDLDWIVMRCLEKDRTRRYDTANGLAADIQRYLRNEPVIARPPSTAYLLQKLIRRHRLAFAAGAVIAGVFAVGVVVSTWQAVRATRAEREQTLLREAAQTAQATETRLRHQAETQELLTRQKAYAADMNLAQQAFGLDNLERAQELLNRQRPQPGQPDLRGWEWRYLWQFRHGEVDSTLCVKNDPLEAVGSLAMSADAAWLAVGNNENGRLSIWNLHTRTETQVPAGEQKVRLVFSPREPLLAFSTEAAIASARPEYCIVLWNAATQAPARTIRLGGSCCGAAFSDDGQTLVTRTTAPENQIALWRVADGTKLASHPAPANDHYYGMSLAITRDFSTAAVVASDEVRVIDLGTGQERWRKKAADEHVLALAFSPDGRILATSAGYAEGIIRLWDVASGSELGTLEGHRSWVGAMVFWSDGKTLASASADHTVRLWEVAHRRLIRTLRGHQREVWQLALSPDNSTLASGGKDGTVLLWDTTKTRTSTGVITLPKEISAWRFVDGGSTVVTVDPRGQVQQWSGRDFRQMSLGMQLKELSSPLRSVALFADGEPLLAVVSSNGKTQVWNWKHNTLEREFKVAPEPSSPVRFLGGGKKLIVARLDPKSTRGDRFLGIHEWDLIKGEQTRVWTGPPNSSDFRFYISPDEQRCLVLGWQGNSSMIDLVSGRQQEIGLKLRQATVAGFSPDGRFFGAGSLLGNARLWDATTFRELGTLTGYLLVPCGVAFSPDGRRLATASVGIEAMKLWDVNSRELLLTLEAPGTFRETSFSPDGSVFGSINDAGLLHLWRAPSWEEIAQAEKASEASAKKP